MPNDQTPMRDSTDTATPLTQETAPWFVAITPGLNVWAHSNAALLAEMSGLATTMHEFSQSRLEANINAFKSLCSCQNPAEMIEHQREYLEIATAQYSRHAQDMSERTVAIISAVAQPATEQA